FFSSRRRHTRFSRDWSSDVCSSDLRRILGWDAEEMLGHPCNELLTDEDRCAGAMQRAMQLALAHGSTAHQRWYRRKDGTQFWGEIGRAACRGRVEGGVGSDWMGDGE